MVTRILLCLLISTLFSFTATEEISSGHFESSSTRPGCTFKGKNLFGKIKFVDSLADVEVEFVCAFPDLKVKFVSAFPDDCGEWQVVDNFPDLRVKIVDANADVKIQVVGSFPGMN